MYWGPRGDEKGMHGIVFRARARGGKFATSAIVLRSQKECNIVCFADMKGAVTFRCVSCCSREKETGPWLLNKRTTRILNGFIWTNYEGDRISMNPLCLNGAGYTNLANLIAGKWAKITNRRRTITTSALFSWRRREAFEGVVGGLVDCCVRAGVRGQS